MKTIVDKKWSNTILGLIIVLFIAKLGLELFGEFGFGENGWRFVGFTAHKKYDQLYNPDEIEVARTAKYFITKNDFLTDVCFDRPNFQETNQLRKTAFRPKYTVLIHILGIKLYKLFHTDLDLSKTYDLPSEYFQIHAFIILIIKNLLLAIALWLFYSVLLQYYSSKVSLFATLLLLIYPSVIYYVGFLNIYECIITAGLVICLGKISILFENPDYKFKSLNLTIIGVSMALFGGLKSQVLLINGLIFMAFGYLYLLKRKEHWTYLFWLSLPSVLMVIGIVVLNHAYFGQYTFSTQGALNFWHGHNPYAKGSWTPLVWQLNWKEIQPFLEKNRAILSQDEATETSFYGRWAIEWILQNPFQEIYLILKKTAILFVPHNMMKWSMNPMTAIFHLSLPLYLFLFFRNSLYNHAFHLFSSAVIVGVWLMSVIFFVDYRWRYFADPFIVFVGFYTYLFLFEKLKHRYLLSKF